jgi:hypothetical protein
MEAAAATNSEITDSRKAALNPAVVCVNVAEKKRGCAGRLEREIALPLLNLLDPASRRAGMILWANSARLGLTRRELCRASSWTFSKADSIRLN